MLLLLWLFLLQMLLQLLVVVKVRGGGEEGAESNPYDFRFSFCVCIEREMMQCNVTPTLPEDSPATTSNGELLPNAILV